MYKKNKQRYFLQVRKRKYKIPIHKAFITTNLQTEFSNAKSNRIPRPCVFEFTVNERKKSDMKKIK